MKHLAAILLIIILFGSKADGQLAPNFTISSLNGETYTLYNELDAGKIVVLAFFSTKSASSIAYHTSQSLTYLYNSHGPDGDNKIQIYYVEGDPTTPQECIFGNCPGSTNLDWTAQIDFPVFNNHLLAQTFNVTNYPSIFIICPDKQMSAVPSLSSNLLWEKAKECPVAFGTYNAGIFNFSPGTVYRDVCNALHLSPSFRLINLGAGTLTNALVKLYWDNNLVHTVEWDGVLQKFESYNLDAGELAVTNGGKLKVVVETPLNPDQYPNDNQIETQFYPAKEFMDDTLILRIRTDEFGYETYWEFRDENENVLQFGGNTNVGPNGGGVIISPNMQSPGTYSNNTTINKMLFVPHGGCYSFHIFDAFGDGLSCTNCSGSGGNTAVGYYRIFNFNDLFTPVISGTPFTTHGRHSFKISGQYVSTNEQTDNPIQTVKIFPNPASGIINLEINTETAQTVSAEVRNMLGSLLYQKTEIELLNGANTLSIPLPQMSAGTYQLNITGTKGTTSKLFLHEN